MPVALVVGTRPESIKMAPVADELGDDAVVVHTGQHDSAGMIQPYRHPGHVVHLPPIRHTSRGDQLGKTVAALAEVFEQIRPDIVAVQGDTTSALAGALAANAAAIPLVHIEAGLRSFDRRMPEEHNRILIDHIADLCCAPTTLAAANLQREGLPAERIVITGNPIVEATTSALPEKPDQFAILTEIGVQPGRYILATVHRPENVDDNTALDAIISALAQSTIPVILPVHPRLAPHIDLLTGTRIRTTRPLEHSRLLALAKHARLIVSDSGGLQEEATVLKKLIIVVRRSNERPEIEGSFGCRVEPNALLETLHEWITQNRTDHNLQQVPSPYGDGTAAVRIAREIRRMRRQESALRDAKPRSLGRRQFASSCPPKSTRNAGGEEMQERDQGSGSRPESMSPGRPAHVAPLMRDRLDAATRG